MNNVKLVSLLMIAVFAAGWSDASRADEASPEEAPAFFAGNEELRGYLWKPQRTTAPQGPLRRLACRPGANPPGGRAGRPHVHLHPVHRHRRELLHGGI